MPQPPQHHNERQPAQRTQHAQRSANHRVRPRSAATSEGLMLSRAISHGLDVRIHQPRYHQGNRSRTIRVRVPSRRQPQHQQQRQTDAGNEPHYQQLLVQRRGTRSPGRRDHPIQHTARLAPVCPVTEFLEGAVSCTSRELPARSSWAHCSYGTNQLFTEEAADQNDIHELLMGVCLALPFPTVRPCPRRGRQGQIHPRMVLGQAPKRCRGSVLADCGVLAADESAVHPDAS